jgi:hypothetical protein
MARRPINVFSLSFLDVMSCGFGAIVLLYLIINHSTEVTLQTVNSERLAEIRKLDFEVDAGQADLTQTTQAIDATQRRLDEATLRRLAIVASLTQYSDQVSTSDAETLARQANLAQLRADVESKEQDVKRLEAKAKDNEGANVRSFIGEGDRQYLTGLKMGGQHILVAFDTSASMLDESIVNVIRRRNMDDARKKAAPKWARAVATVEWLAAQFPLDSQFQIIGFNESAKVMADGTEGRWIDVANAQELDRTMTAIKALIPSGGTNLEKLAATIAAMAPPPDNIYLVTDGLPTQGSRGANNATVTGRQRIGLFNEAVKLFPRNVPINVIMFPLEGDPGASGAFWGLAQGTGGSYLAPARDWP